MEKVVWDLKSQLEKFDATEKVFDCMVAEFLLCDGRYIPQEDKALIDYKVASLEELAQKQKERLEELPKLKKLYYDIELPLVLILGQMEKNGIMLDTQCLGKVGLELDKAISEIEDKIKKEIGVDINLNSSIQIGNFLAEKVSVPLSKTKTGRYATNEQEISQFAKDFPIVADLLIYRELSKLRSTYVASLIDKVDGQGRVHTSYNQVAVSTGRLSSANPNLQNIPVTSEFGQKIKSCFVASPGHVLLSFDYSQQELRILAHLTGEERLIEAFIHAQDVHKTTATQLFHVSYEDVTKDQRSVAKTINFGIIYGMSSFGMSQGLTIPVDEAQAFIDTFYATYPKIRSFYDHYLKQGQIDGYVETLLGRRRTVFAYPGQKFIDNSMRRVLMNYPIQGTAADLMKKAMVDIDREILQKNKDVKLLLQIHDDLVFEVSHDPKIYSPLMQQIKDLMCGVYKLSVPIEVDVKMGKNWGEMGKVSS
ncbi:MAG TPA: DNA polymerase [Patescibacteria group bacterium]|nr:DNA polymerase [Patescibacteria group bacterium]